MATKEPPGPDDLQPFASLFKSDEHIGYVICRLCDQPVLEIKPHLADKHRNCSLEMYIKSFPKEELYARAALHKKETRDVTEIEVSEDEAAAHPAGYDGAYIEAHLDPNERREYRRHVVELKEKNYPDRTTAKIAYHQVIASRLFKIIERAQALSTGEVLPTEHIDAYTKMQQKVDTIIAAADQELRMRADASSPFEVVESTMAQAEEYVRTHQGEFTCRCQNCGELHIPPGIPHWAFAPISTYAGTQYPVWSAEMWQLVHEGAMELWMMAFALRTSPEGLLFTATRRGDAWPPTINLADQERKLRARLVSADRAYDTARRLIDRPAPEEPTP